MQLLTCAELHLTIILYVAVHEAVHAVFYAPFAWGESLMVHAAVSYSAVALAKNIGPHECCAHDGCDLQAHVGEHGLPSLVTTTEVDEHSLWSARAIVVYSEILPWPMLHDHELLHMLEGNTRDAGDTCHDSCNDVRV